MIGNDKVREIANKLLEKSRKGQVRWTSSDNDLGGEPRNWYAVTLPDAHILLEFNSPSVDPDYYELTIRNSEGTVIGRLIAFDESLPTDELKTLKECYNEAGRITHHWDTTLHSIEAALDADSTIGEVEIKERADSALF